MRRTSHPGRPRSRSPSNPPTGGPFVRLVHDGLTDAQAASHGEGWDHFLERLSIAGGTGDAGADDWAASPDPLDQLSAAEAALALCQLVLREMSESDARASTPCAKFTVADLVDHLLGSISHLGSMAGADIAVPPEGAMESRVASAAQQTLEAWRHRGIEGEVLFGSRPMPASRAASILSMEFLVHAWDFSVATSKTLAPSDYVLGLARELIAPPVRDGDRFGAEVEVGPDAGAMERLAAFTGRAG